jgi:acyl carrier protein
MDKTPTHWQPISAGKHSIKHEIHYIIRIMGLEDFLKQEIKNIAFKTVNNTDSLIASGLLSSITVVDLVVSIEEKYDIKIPFNDITNDNFDNIQLIKVFLKSRGLKTDE